MTKDEMKDGNTLLLFAMVVFYPFSSAITLPIFFINQWDGIIAVFVSCLTDHLKQGIIRKKEDADTLLYRADCGSFVIYL